VTAAILQCLARFPNAEDDLEGVADTWLSPFRFRIERSVLLEALAQLEGRGIVVRRQSGDGRTRFARRRGPP